MLPLPHLRNLPKHAARSFTTGTLPAYIDPSQPPTKKQPFAALHAQRWVSHLDVLLPSELADIVAEHLATMTQRYAKVIMKVGDLLEGEFFTDAVKKGNVMMMSEGSRGVDDRFELFEGTLRMEIDKATYERAGLQGKPMRDGGLKHKDNRYAIEIDLRQPSMLHGKKGFERIIWACKNVLDQSLTWVFLDCSRAEERPASAALEKHHPRWYTSSPSTTTMPDVELPAIDGNLASTPLDLDFAADLEDWISLVAMDSPRIRSTDKTNPFICRYSLPQVYPSATRDREHSYPAILQRLQWHGFLSSSFVLEIMLRLKKAAATSGQWFALRSVGIGRDANGLTLMQLPGENEKAPGFLCWHLPA